MESLEPTSFWQREDLSFGSKNRFATKGYVVSGQWCIEYRSLMSYLLVVLLTKEYGDTGMTSGVMYDISLNVALMLTSLSIKEMFYIRT